MGKKILGFRFCPYHFLISSFCVVTRDSFLATKRNELTICSHSIYGFGVVYPVVISGPSACLSTILNNIYPSNMQLLSEY